MEKRQCRHCHKLNKPEIRDIPAEITGLESWLVHYLLCCYQRVMQYIPCCWCCCCCCCCSSCSCCGHHLRLPIVLIGRRHANKQISTRHTMQPDAFLHRRQYLLTPCAYLSLVVRRPCAGTEQAGLPLLDGTYVVLAGSTSDRLGGYSRRWDVQCVCAAARTAERSNSRSTNCDRTRNNLTSLLKITVLTVWLFFRRLACSIELRT